MDIVERLRSWSHAQSNHPQLLREAADEIARLQSENERLDQLAEHNALIALHREDEIKRLVAEVARLEAELRVAYKLPSAINAALAPPPRREECTQCGAEVFGFHRCPGLPGENQF